MTEKTPNERLETLLSTEPDYLDGQEFREAVTHRIKRIQIRRRVILASVSFVGAIGVALSPAIQGLGAYIALITSFVGNFAYFQMGLMAIGFTTFVWLTLAQD